MYNKVDVHEVNNNDDPVDEAGYIGQFHREKTTLTPINETDLIKIIHKNNKLADIIRKIKEIDQQRNGFITQTELDDILKIIYKDELYNKDLMPIIRQYSSIQNKILINYKEFRDHIVSEIKRIDRSYTITGMSTINTSPSKEPKGLTINVKNKYANEDSFGIYNDQKHSINSIDKNTQPK